LANAQKAISINKDIPMTYYVAGMAYREQKEYVKALVAAQKTIALDPNYANGHALLASLLYYTGRPEESIERSCPSRWCKSADHGLSSMVARAARHAAAMRRGRACGSSLRLASFSRLM
jgi:predicted Zn-dependent protease